MRARLCSIVAALAVCRIVAGDDPTTRPDDPPPYRTEFTGPQLPWYKLTPGEFPPLHSEHRVGGELVEADFIHRTGVFRSDVSGQLNGFSLLPYASVFHLGAEADLRDIPLGTHLVFHLYQDGHGSFSQAAALQDNYTALAKDGLRYRVSQIKLGPSEGAAVLVVSLQRPDDKGPAADPQELPVDAQTLIFKGDHAAKVADLVVGDELLVNRAGISGRPAGCSMEIYAGAEAQKRATEQQHKAHVAFIKQRGIAARIDQVEQKNIVVTLLGDAAELASLLKEEKIDPQIWAKEHRQVKVAVANEELRTYNPPVDNEASRVVEFQAAPTDCFGSGGVQWTITPNLLLEGFRKGRIVRIFAHPSWPIEDMPFGEGLYTERPGAKVEEEAANQYSYRTDFANAHLPWYQLKPGEFPPFQSHHLETGELLNINAAHRSGQFRRDRTGDVINFAMPPFGSISYLDSDAELADLPLGQRFYFSLYQDENGAFTRAAVISDEFTRLSGENLTCRVEAIKPDEGKIYVAYQLAPMKDDKDHMVQPPDLGHAEFGVDETTRVWKGDKQIKLADIVVGDALLVNLTGGMGLNRPHCADIWDGPDAQKLAKETQRSGHKKFLRENGLPAWIENVDGQMVTLTFFAGRRKDFADALDGDPNGQIVSIKLADDELRAADEQIVKMKFRTHPPELNTAGTYGSAGVRWILDADKLPEDYKPGRVVRVFKADWRK